MAEYYHNDIEPLVCPFTFVEEDWEEIEEVRDLSWTLSFYPDFDYWLSYHDFQPFGIFATRNNVLSFNDKEIYVHNQENFVKYYKGEIFKSLINPVLKSPYNTRNKYVSAVFTNVLFRCDIVKDKKVDRNKTLTRISFHNSYQSSNKITLIPFDDRKTYLEQYDQYNIRLSHNYWQFNKFRDLKLDKRELTWEEWDSLKTIVFNENNSEIETLNTNIDNNQPIQRKRKFIDEYMIVLLEFDNEEQDQFLLHDINYITLPALR